MGDDINLTPFELERLATIKRNEEVLASLGLYSLLPAPKQPRPVQRKRKEKEKENQNHIQVAAQECRKSRRLLGLAVEHSVANDPFPDEVIRDSGNRPPRRIPPKVPKEATQKELDDLNKYRASYMSDDALRRRIGAIKRIDKMESFVQILKSEGRDELAAEAEKALQKLTAHR